MDRNIRRALYTALVAGGLVVVGASSAHAAGNGLSDPATQGATGTAVGAATAREAAVHDGGAADGVADGTAGSRGIVGALLQADVVGVVEGVLGEDGLVAGLPGTLDPGAGDPATEEPAPHAPGADGYDPDSPGEQGGPGTGRPVTDVVETSVPRTGAVEAPRADDVSKPEHPGSEPQDDMAASQPDAHAAGASGSAADTAVDTAVDTDPDTADASDATGSGELASPAPVADGADDLRGEGVDIGWGDESEAALTAYDGTILPVGVEDALQNTLTGYDGQEVAPVPSGDAPAHRGPMITGQLALVSLLLGLGLAVLRTCRRPDVV